MIKRNNNSRAIIDPISIIGGLFLVITLIVSAVVVKNRNASLNINEKAASSCTALCLKNATPDECGCNGNTTGIKPPSGSTGAVIIPAGGTTGSNAKTNNDGDTGNDYTGVVSSNNIPASNPQCVPNCGSHNCGDNGCGGNCGTCTPPAICGGGGIGICGAASNGAVGPVPVADPTANQPVTTSCKDKNGTDINEGTVVVGATSGESLGYSRCVGGLWVNNCSKDTNVIRLCAIEDLTPTKVPQYLMPEYIAAIEAQQQLLNPATETYVSGPSIQNTNQTTTQTTAVSLTEEQQREKSLCLQEGGSWINNICSYQQQNNAATTFKPILQALQIEESTCTRNGGTWSNGKCDEPNVEANASGNTENNNLWTNLFGGNSNTNTSNPCPAGSTWVSNTCVTNQQNITNAENQIATLNKTPNTSVTTTSLQDLINSLTNRFNNVSQNTGMTELGTYGLGGGNAYVAPIPQRIVSSKNASDFYNYAIGNVVSNIAGFTTATLSTPGAPLFLFETATSIPGVVPILATADVVDNAVTGISCASGNQDACSIFQAQLFIPVPTGTASMLAGSIDDFAKAMRTPLQSIDNLSFLDSIMRLDGTDMGGLPTIANSAIPDSTSSMLFAPNYQNSWSGLIPENAGGTNITNLANDISQINLHNPTTNLGDIGVTVSDVYPAGWANDGISGLGFPNGYQFPKPSKVSQRLADLVDTIGINPIFGNIYPDGMVGRSLDSVSSMIDGTLDDLANNVPLDVTFTLDDIAEVRPSVQNELIDNLTTPEVVASTSIPESIRQWWGNTVGDLNLAGLSPEVDLQLEINQANWFQRYIAEPIQNQFDNVISKFDNIAQSQLVELDAPAFTKSASVTQKEPNFIKNLSSNIKGGLTEFISVFDEGIQPSRSNISISTIDPKATTVKISPGDYFFFGSQGGKQIYIPNDVRTFVVIGDGNPILIPKKGMDVPIDNQVVSVYFQDIEGGLNPIGIFNKTTFDASDSVQVAKLYRDLPPSRISSFVKNYKYDLIFGSMFSGTIIVPVYLQNRDIIENYIIEKSHIGYYSPTLDTWVYYEQGDWKREDNGEAIPRDIEFVYLKSGIIEADLADEKTDPILNIGEELLLKQYVTVQQSYFNSSEWIKIKNKTQGKTAANPYDVNLITQSIHENMVYNEITKKAGDAYKKGNFFEKIVYREIAGLQSIFSSNNLENLIEQDKTICFEFSIVEQIYLAEMGISSTITTGNLYGDVNRGHAFLKIIGDDGREWIADPTAGLVMEYPKYIESYGVTDIQQITNNYEFINNENTPIFDSTR